MPYKLVHKYTTTNVSVRMPPELSLEILAKNIENINSSMGKFIATEEDKEEKEKEAKKAEDEKKEEEKKEAKKAKYNSAIKVAMDEEDHEKKMAAIKKAQDEYDEKHEAFGEPKDKKHEAMDEDEKKEHDAQIASIINEKKNSLIKQILTANRIVNPASLRDVETRLKTASITDIEKEWNILAPFIAGVEPQAQTQEKVIPFFANIQPTEIDASQLNAASPPSDFNKFTTKELLEMGQ